MQTTAGTRTARTENFPVAARFLSPRLRSRILAFYDFARAADDVADDPDLAPAARLDRLDAFEAGLAGGPGAPEAVALHAAVKGEAAPLAEARALLGAFRQDARGADYASWPDLRAYCAMSADPVGRFLLALHGEDARAARLSDPLCTALQVLNHLQDLRPDALRLGRVYLPRDWMAAAGAEPHELTRDRLSPGARRVVDRALDECDRLLAAAGGLPAAIRARGLRGQAAATLHLARTLSARLRRRDPLAGRVAAGRLDIALAALLGLGSAARSARC